MLLWLLALLSSAAPAQASPQPSPPVASPYIVRAWGTGDGLPQNTVTAIVQTRDGYLWLGTFGGLVRFDGLTFTVFDPGNSPGLASARITSLHEDSQRVLWIGTEAGLTKLELGRFTSYTTKDGLLSGVIAVLVDQRGRLWAGTEGGLTRFDRPRISMQSRAVFPIDTYALAESPTGEIWVGARTSVVRFRDDDTTELLSAPGTHPFRALLFDRQGTAWAGGNELWRWNGSRFDVVPLPLPSRVRGPITALAQDRSGTFWVGATGAAWYSRDDNAAFVQATGLSDRSVNALLGDSVGNVWIGTQIGGLDRLKRRHVVSYPRESIGPIVDDGADGVWIGGTCGGLLHFTGGRFVAHDLGTLNHCIWALYRDADGTVWIGSTAGGLTRFKDGRATSYLKKDGLLSDTVIGVARDRDGMLWIGTPNGLNRWDGSAFTRYQAAQGLSHDVSAIMQDRHGALWLGGLGGLSRFADGRFTHFTTAQGLSHDHVRAIHEDADGVLWIGTYGGGLNRFKGGRFTTIGIREGLPDAAVSRIIEDARGNFWMSGNKGVYRVARSQLNDFADGRISYVTAVVYGTADGMVIDETNGGQPAGWQTPDGKLWFPTIKGLVGIDPVTEPAAAPPVYVERTVVAGQSLEAEALSRLGPGIADAEFHYTAIDLKAAEKTRFRYRLNGENGAWIDAGTRRVAYFTNLRPGSYTFEVIATNSDGVWGTTPARVSLVVIPFWWQRTETIVAALFLLVAVTGFVVRYATLRRARARVAELERERALERERTRIARDLHDDLGSRLSHIAMMADASAAADPEARIAGAARAAVQTMDELVWAVNARNDTVENFAYYVAQYAEEHVIGAGLRCRLELPPDLPPRPLAADMRRHLYLAVKEAINNALKHAGASEIRLSLRIDTHALAVEVADDGRGLPEAIDATGNGLKNFRERMDAAGGTLEVASAPGQGTRLTFTVPL
jgi:ligand-binding sensor domain-containing protein/signal transduction histidine kinase